MYKERWQPILALILGVYIIASPWLIPYFLTDAKLALEPAWGHYFAGMAIVIVAAFAMMSFGLWTVWLEVLLGIWTIIAPWLLGFSSLSVFTWNSVIVGIVLIAISVDSLRTELMQSA
ncbi:SPW repeat protein [Castellaniella sp. WN]